MNKIIKNQNDSENKQDIPIHSKTICKRSTKENYEEKIEKKRLKSNKRERIRTQMRNEMFEKLKTKFKKDATKQEILYFSKKYLEFLYFVSIFDLEFGSKII